MLGIPILDVHCFSELRHEISFARVEIQRMMHVVVGCIRLKFGSLCAQPENAKRNIYDQHEVHHRGGSVSDSPIAFVRQCVVFGLDDTCSTAEDTSLLSVRLKFEGTQGESQGEVEAHHRLQEDTEAPVVQNPRSRRRGVRGTFRTCVFRFNEGSLGHSIRQVHLPRSGGATMTVDGVAVVGTPGQDSASKSGLTSGGWNVAH